MTFKELAVKQAQKNNCEIEVQYFYDENIRLGKCEETAWRNALDTWEAFPWEDKEFLTQWIDIANKENKKGKSK